MEEQPTQNQNENKTEDQAELKSGNTKSNTQTIAALAYIVFFLPLILDEKSEFGRYHANQGLLLLITVVVVNVVGIAIPFIGWSLILPVGNILAFVLFIMGFISALNGEKKPLPVIGELATLIK